MIDLLCYRKKLKWTKKKLKRRFYIYTKGLSDVLLYVRTNTFPFSHISIALVKLIVGS